MPRSLGQRSGRVRRQETHLYQQCQDLDPGSCRFLPPNSLDDDFNRSPCSVDSSLHLMMVGKLKGYHWRKDQATSNGGKYLKFIASLIFARSGISPVRMYLPNATNNLRANATMPIFRLRLAPPPNFARYQRANSLLG